MRSGKILSPNETPQELFDRVIATIASIEQTWNTPHNQTALFANTFADLWNRRVFTLGTPTLTNAGRADHKQSALSSCVVIPVDLANKTKAKEKILSYYKQNMGSGFDFTPYQNPVELLIWLNDLAATETATGKYDRYIGNMGNLHVTHPKVREFIQAKKDRKLPHFNISIDVTDTFMQAAFTGQSFALSDGTMIDANELLRFMAECSWVNGDPGIISLERMNHDNPVSDISAYTSTPPCSEMGLAPGETCQFGYINVASVIREDKSIDWPLLEQATKILTRALDNAIEVSLAGFPDKESARLAKLKRKIGIGICGVADALIQAELPYNTQQARTVIRDILSYINFTSKQASIELARERGSCEAMNNSEGNKYYDHFLQNRYQHGCNAVSTQDWKNLDAEIAQNKLLRNILTTALPPTGRASILLEVTSSIEPLFSASGWNDDTERTIRQFLIKHAGEEHVEHILQKAHEQQSFLGLGIAQEDVLKTAKEILPADHIAMMAALAGKHGVCDETISKTVNLPHQASVEDVYEIFVTSYQAGLKNISVYRDGTHENQPQKL